MDRLKSIADRIAAAFIGVQIDIANRVAHLLVECADALQARAELLGHRYRSALRRIDQRP